MRPLLEVPDFFRKTVGSVALHDDPASGRELTVRFIDGTEQSVMVSCRQIAVVRHFHVAEDRTLFEQNEAEL